MAEDRSIPYLAMYGFRSKQEYIYRTNKLREITGASELMAGLFDDFLDANLETDKVDGGVFPVLRIRNDWREGREVSSGETERKVYQVRNGNEEIDDVRGELAKGGLDGVVVFEGGGNLCVLYRNRRAYEMANASFSRLVLDRGYNLSLLAAGVEWIEGDALKKWIEAKVEEENRSTTSEFRVNISRVHEAQDARKRTCPQAGFVNALPFTAVNRDTFQPVRGYLNESMGLVSKKAFPETLKDAIKRGALSCHPEGRYACSMESLQKRYMYQSSHKERDRNSNGTWLDDITTNKGKESLLAAVYVDGNSMGNRLKEAGRELSSMRKFSVSTNETFVGRTKAAVVETIGQLSNGDWNPDWESTDKNSDDDPGKNYRIIVDHGDEMTLICNAHAVPAVVRAYFEALQQGDSTNSACLGIAIFHSHDPFSEVYEIAEACCEQGKKRNRQCIKLSADADASYVDFHFCRSGITGSLEAIREAQEAELVMRPYRYSPFSGEAEGEDFEGTPYELLINAADILYVSVSKRGGGIVRSDVKALGAAALKGKPWFLLEWERCCAKDPSLRSLERISEKDTWNRNLPEALKVPKGDDILMRVVFDISSFFDIWFAHGEHSLPASSKKEKDGRNAGTNGGDAQ